MEWNARVQSERRSGAKSCVEYGAPKHAGRARGGPHIRALFSATALVRKDDSACPIVTYFAEVDQTRFDRPRIQSGDPTGRTRAVTRRTAPRSIRTAVMASSFAGGRLIAR